MTKHFVFCCFIFMSPVAALSFENPTSTEQVSVLKLAEDGQTDKLKLLPASTDWNVADSQGETALIKAVAHEHVQTVRLLLQKKVKINLKDKAGNSAVFYAVSNNSDKIVHALIRAGAKLDDRYGPKNENLIFEAARVGAQKIADKILKGKHGFLNQANSQGETPFFTAIESAQFDFALYLIRSGASLKVVTKSGQTLAQFAEQHGVDKKSELGQKILQGQ